MFEYEVSNKVPILMAISTCPRCQRMKQFLQMNGVKAKIVDVDLLSPEEKKSHMRFIQPINPRLSFPTLIVGDLAVIGEDYDGAKEVLGI